jgi:hypothetical protein
MYDIAVLGLCIDSDTVATPAAAATTAAGAGNSCIAISISFIRVFVYSCIRLSYYVFPFILFDIYIVIRHVLW